MTILFPLPYDGSDTNTKSWDAAKVFEGKAVTIRTTSGATIKGKVHRAELSSIGRNYEYGVGFHLAAGLGAFSSERHIKAAEIASIEADRERDYIIVKAAR